MNTTINVSEKLLERYRYINVEDHFWSEPIQEEFIKQMEKVGIQVDDIFFDVSGGPGSGACFEGYVYDWELFLKALGYDNPALIELACNYWDFKARHEGYYYHPKSIEFDADIVLPDGWDKEEFIYKFSPYPEDDVRSYAWYAILKRYDSETLEERFIDVFLDHMYALEKRLEDEFESLTSDEAVTEAIVENGLMEE